MRRRINTVFVLFFHISFAFLLQFLPTSYANHHYLCTVTFCNYRLGFAYSAAQFSLQRTHTTTIKLNTEKTRKKNEEKGFGDKKSSTTNMIFSAVNYVPPTCAAWTATTTTAYRQHVNMLLTTIYNRLASVRNRRKADANIQFGCMSMWAPNTTWHAAQRLCTMHMSKEHRQNSTLKPHRGRRTTRQTSTIDSAFTLHNTHNRFVFDNNNNAIIFIITKFCCVLQSKHVIHSHLLLL